MKNTDQIIDTVRKVRAGEMKVTQKNADLVKAVWLDIVHFNALLQNAGLGWLPDDEDKIYTEGEQLLEDWIANAYAGNHERGAEGAREALMGVKAQVLEETQ